MIEHGTLEANVTRHCINSCACCSHASPISPRYFMEPKQLEKDIAGLKPFVHFKQFYLLGGEPLLHPRVCDLLDIVTASGIANDTCMLTNGVLLNRVPPEFWDKVDFIRMSAYDKPNRSEVVAYAKKLCAEHNVGLGVDYIDLFWKQFKPSPDDGRASFAMCPWKGACWTVHDGHFYLCPGSAFYPDTIMSLPQNVDGLPIEGLTEQKFLDFINRKEPLRTCTICHSFKERNPWHEVHGREAWIKDATL